MPPEKELACHFWNLRAKNDYPGRFTKCSGNIISIKECKENIDPNYGERYIILVRSGFINQYSHVSEMGICSRHRNIFGKNFAKEFKQKKCVYPNHEKGKMARFVVSMEQARAWLDEEGRIVPYGAHLCVKCSFCMRKFMTDMK